MKINSANNINYKGHSGIVKNFKRAAGEKFAKIDQIGEGTNIALDFAGKAVLVPATIMLVSKEDKEKKEYSALKNPVAAIFQLLMEVPILILCSKYVENLANRNKLNKIGGKISYNEKSAKENFIKALNKASGENLELEKSCKEIVEKLNKKGFGRIIKEDFEQAIENFGGNYKKELKESLKNLDLTHKRLYHLQNRVSFVAAIALTPILCKAEDYFFPKVMNKIVKKPENNSKPKKFLTLQHFKSLVSKRGAKCHKY